MVCRNAASETDNGANECAYAGRIDIGQKCALTAC